MYGLSDDIGAMAHELVELKKALQQSELRYQALSTQYADLMTLYRELKAKKTP